MTPSSWAVAAAVLALIAEVDAPLGRRAAPAAPPIPAAPPVVAPPMQTAREAPLRLDEVLASSANWAPQIVEALARVRAADARQLTAAGAFDLVFSAEGQARPIGYYDGTVAEAKLSAPLLSNGGQVYAGYRLSDGRFPIYEDRSYTNRAGEVKVGVIFALLRDRHIDERRFQLGNAWAEREAAALDARMVAIGVQRRAVVAYQAWTAAGLRLRIYRDLLALASARRAAFDRQIALGARPQVLAVENRQNIVRRETLVARAEQELSATANALSFYWRDVEGRPVIPGPERLPNALPALRAPELSPDLIERPDLEALSLRVTQADRRIELERNNLRPRLDLRVEGARDLGPVGPGGVSRAGTEAIVGFSFSVPLQQRAGAGRLGQARAERDAQRARLRQLEEQLRIDVRAVIVDAQASRKLLDLAGEEAGLAERMAAAERRRFELGASDFFLVNQREETAADARVRSLDAELRLASARLELVAVAADEATLGLTGTRADSK